jgi:6-phosphogluconolactonase
VTPDGRSFYVADTATNTVWQYSIDQGTGRLSPKSPATVPAGTGPAALAVSPDGRSLYVHDSGIGGGGPATNAVSQYDIDATRGTLSPKSPPTVSALGQNTAAEIVVTPDGRSVYLVQTTVILQYHVDPATGGLTPKTPATVPTAGSATGIVLATPPPGAPTSKEQCRHGGWRAFPQFKNQGQCVSFVTSRKPRPPG